MKALAAEIASLVGNKEESESSTVTSIFCTHAHKDKQQHGYSRLKKSTCHD